MSFESLGLSDPLVRGVRAAGYRSTTAIQSDASPHSLGGKDLFGVSKTGSGKTAAFCLPMLQRLAKLHPVGVPHGIPANHRRTRALVLSPTRESAAQIGERLKVYGQFMPLTHAVLHAGGNHSSQTMALRNGVDILVATPGWLHELMVQGYVYLAGLQFVVIDEADRMLQAGMLHYLTNILRALPSNRQSVLFSESQGEAVVEFAAVFLKHQVNVGFKPPKPKPAPRSKSVPAVGPAKPASKPVPPKGNGSRADVRRPETPGADGSRAGQTKGTSRSAPTGSSAGKSPSVRSKSAAVRAEPAKSVRRSALAKPAKSKSVADKSSASKPGAAKSVSSKVPAPTKAKAAKTKSGQPKAAISKASKVNAAKGKQGLAAARVSVKPRSAARAKAQRSKVQTAKSAARGRSA
jgi:hypothetical protein